MTQTQTPGIKAIETVYNGYRFRSRLEARWAVFFDALGVKYEYEKEGYDLGEAGWYLPDFWLETVHMWAEVKPGPFSDVEKARCHALAEQSGYECLMLDGMPEYRAYFACTRDPVEEPELEPYTMPYLLDNQYLDQHRFYHWPELKPGQVWWDVYSGPDCTNGAYDAARQARFEHGETPRPIQPQRTVKPSDALALESEIPGYFATEERERLHELHERERTAKTIATLRAWLEESELDPGVREIDKRAVVYRLKRLELSERMRELDDLQRIAEHQNDGEALRTLLAQKLALMAEKRRVETEYAPPKAKRGRRASTTQPSPPPQQSKRPKSWVASPLTDLHPGDRVEHWLHGFGVIEVIHDLVFETVILFDSGKRLTLAKDYARLKLVAETPTVNKL